MNGNHSSDDFLTAATDGLKHDPELRLDVRAELLAHLEDHRRAAEAEGQTPEAAAEEALQAMGPAPDLAAQLEQANRSRLRLRGWVRFGARWLLAPLAVAVALLTAHWDAFRVYAVISMMAGVSVPDGDPGPSMRHPRLTPDQALVLHGDRARPNRVEQEKAIWERWPANRTYLHNYLSHRLSDLSGKAETNRWEAFFTEIETLRAQDPDNARFDLMLAGKMLDLAVDVKSRSVTNDQGEAKTVYDVAIQDRARLDAAMSQLMAGLQKKEYRRYSREMAAERMAILGEADSVLEQIAQIGLLAGILLPDLAYTRNLGRVSLFYGELLAKEGRREEADFFLKAPLRLAQLLNRDAFTLIDVLVIGAIASYAEEQGPAIYERLGDPDAAARLRGEADRLAAPVKQWKAKRKEMEKSPEGLAWQVKFVRHGGILASLLLPAIGEYPSTEELAPSRLLEYVMAEGFALSGLSVLLFFAMLASSGLAGLIGRRTGPSSPALLLLPEPGQVLRLLAFGVLGPLLLYYAATRWLPGSGRDLNMRAGGIGILLAQLGWLIVLLFGLTFLLTRRLVRRRCRELLIPVTTGEGGTGAAYWGSLFRTLVPVLALAMILVNLCSRPYLRWQERRLLRIDTLMKPDPNGGFTSIESRLTQRLKAEMEKAAAGAD